MRAPIPFDTHAYVKKLIAAGVPERQAEVQAEALADIALANLATKDDLRALEQRMDARFKELEQRMDARFAQVEARFSQVDARFSQMELRLTLRLGALLAAAVGALAAIVKFL